MLEERLDHIETMLTDLIRIVGKTNALVQETCQRVTKLEGKYDHLEARFDQLETRFDQLEKRFDKLEEKVDKNHAEVMDKLAGFSMEQDFLMQKVAKNEVDIYKIKRAINI